MLDGKGIVASCLLGYSLRIMALSFSVFFSFKCELLSVCGSSILSSSFGASDAIHISDLIVPCSKPSFSFNA
jgi:hypothetical protein